MASLATEPSERTLGIPPCGRYDGGVSSSRGDATAGKAADTPDNGGAALNREQRELLRRLTLNDETVLADVLSGRVPGGHWLLDGKSRSLVRLAGLVALDSETASLHAAVDAAHGAGAADEEILELVVAVAPLVGASRISSALPGISVAMERD